MNNKKIMLGIGIIATLLLLLSCSDNGSEEESNVEQGSCGDGVCDAQEGQDPQICPKDCEAQTQEIERDETAEEFTFIPDEGLRMENAANPGARVNEDETISLLYRDFVSGTFYMSTSEDGLTFEQGTKLSEEEGDNFRAKKLPDGTWRGYDYDSEQNCLTSHSSEDAVSFTYDKTCSYIFPETDNAAIGVYDFFVDQEGGIVLIYTGDRQGEGNENGLNNLRRAYSTDNGITFTFTNGNVVGDEDLGGGGNSYVDQKVVLLEDGSVFLIAMKKGNIYGFISTDNGVSFTRIEEPLLAPTDFSSIANVEGMTDPQIIQLPDERYRIYVKVLIDEGTDGPSSEDREGIASATTK